MPGLPFFGGSSGDRGEGRRIQWQWIQGCRVWAGFRDAGCQGGRAPMFGIYGCAAGGLGLKRAHAAFSFQNGVAA